MDWNLEKGVEALAKTCERGQTAQLNKKKDLYTHQRQHNPLVIRFNSEATSLFKHTAQDGAAMPLCVH
jgi:hypothetical protein